jgi:hypothetical protein
MAAEQLLPFVPAAGRDFVTLTSWAGDAAFGVTPVANGQIEGPDTWTLNADGTVAGSDGTETLRYIAPSGMAYAASYTIENPDVVDPFIDTLVATGTDPDTIDVSFNTDEDNGTRYVFASANASETEADIRTGAQATTTVTATGAQTDTLTLAVGDYYVHVLHDDDEGNPSNVLSSAQITLAATASSAQVTRPFVGGSVYTVATLQTGFQAYAFEQWPTNEPAVGWQLITLTADGVYYDSQGNWFDTVEGIYDVWVIDLNGMAYKQTLDSTQLQTTATDVPQGTWAIGTVTVGHETASFTPVYNLSDATIYEYTLNGVDYIAFTGTISLSSLSPETAYNGNVKAANGAGDGAPVAFSFTTDAVPVTPEPPTLDLALPDLNLSETEAISINLDSYFTGATSYTVSGFPAGSGLSLSGDTISGNATASDTGASPFTLTVTAINGDGSIQDSFGLTVVDDIAPTLIIYSMTTLNTAPIVFGACGDAVSLILVVNGVTYNPAPSGGTWSQQLPTLPLATYEMTLDGQDAAGNVAGQVKANLHIVDTIVSTASGYISSLIRPAITPMIKDIAA